MVLTNAVRAAPLSSKIFSACAIWLIGLGVYFILLRPALLPEDPRFMGTSIEVLRAAAPGLERWLGHVFDVLRGFMVATGTLTLLVACRSLSGRPRGALIAMVVAGASGVALMSATNFILHSDFRFVLLAPALLWLAGVWRYLREDSRARRTAP